MQSGDMDRFVRAQDAGGTYARALRELRAGRKTSHWMWFVFPQLSGLGFSPTAQFYGIGGMPEARAFLAHSLLGPRLVEAARAVLALEGRSISAIFGSPDDVKFRSSMTLFDRAAENGEEVFRRALDQMCGGEADPRTLELLRGHN